MDCNKQEQTTVKKFKLVKEDTIDWGEKILYRIKACRDFVTASGNEIKAGDFGGFVENESNLSQVGNAWIFDSAKVYGNAKVCGNAMVCGGAEVCGNATVCGGAKVYGNATVCGNAMVYDDAEVYGDTKTGRKPLIF